MTAKHMIKDMIKNTINAYENECEERNLTPSRRDKILIKVIAENLIVDMGKLIESWYMENVTPLLQEWIESQELPAFEDYLNDKYILKLNEDRDA